MAKSGDGFWSRGWAYLTDGTFREVWEAWGKKDHDEDAKSWEFDEHGFRRLRSESFPTRKIESYKAIVRNPEEWQAFEAANMNHYFHDGVVLFPYDRPEGSAPKIDVGPANYTPPGRFFRVQYDMIKRRFPFGLNKTPGDADMRRTISALRYIFSKNFWRLIRQRRVLAGLMILGFIACQAVSLAVSAGLPFLLGFARVANIDLLENLVPAGMCALCLLLFVGLYSHAVEQVQRLKDQYEAAVRASCLLLGRNLQVRQQDIIATIPLIFTEADNDKFVLKDQGKITKWPEEVRKWTKLAFWMAGRVEYNELAMQLQMWRIRRLHFGMKWWASFITGVMKYAAYLLVAGIFAAFLAVLYLTRAPWSSSASWYIMLGATTLMTLITALFSRSLLNAANNRHLVELDLIENSIITQNIEGHKDVKLHDIVAQQLFREKSALLHEEEKGKR